MTTKVLNKLVNICATLSGDEVSTGTTSSGTSLTESELFDIIYPVGSIVISSIYAKDDTTKIFSYGTWQYMFQASIPSLEDLEDADIVQTERYLYKRTA